MALYPDPENRDSPAVLAAEADGAPVDEAPVPGDNLERRTKKTQVLSRKAVERTIMLEVGSRQMIDTSKALVSEARRRNTSAVRTLSKSRQKAKGGRGLKRLCA